MWTTSDDVKAELGHVSFTPADVAWIDRCVDSVNEQVSAWRPDLVEGQSGPVCLGATKLAASMFRRRGASGAEFAEFADIATASLPGVIDAEIQSLIGIGRHHNPIVA